MTAFASVLTHERIDHAGFERDLRPLNRPVLLKGQIADWPVVVAARQSPEAVGDYFRSLDGGASAQVSLCPPSERGRYFYAAGNLRQMNFQTFTKPFRLIVDTLLSQMSAPQNEAIYMQAVPVESLMPGFCAQNPMTLLPLEATRPRLWLGNEVRVQTHFDPSYNLACVLAGQRRFTLFPPDQTRNLYPGPFEISPGGVPVSMASLEEPDFERFPRLKDALATAQVAEMEPGDVLYIPYMWWHHVQSSGGFNALLNYWWNDVPAGAPPYLGLIASVMSYKAMPEDQKAVWRELLDIISNRPHAACSAPRIRA
jgi:hypothetical protein